jgi:ClpP class serine protease
MKLWLIDEDVLSAMAAGRERSDYQPTQAERESYFAAMREAHASKTADRPRNMQVAGGVAAIGVKGVLTQEPDCIAQMFGPGNTTYPSIIKALAQADADPSISAIEMNIASPGGTVEGLFETLAAIEATKKPITVKASLAASAAYAIAAMAGPIEAVGPASVFGSIGVATRIRVSKEVVDVASKEAPAKRPDVTTPEGMAAVQGELDALHELFADAIARGRSHTTGQAFDVARVNKEFGRGGVLLSEAAKSRGMIDSMPKPVKRAPRGKNATAEIGGAEQPERKRMTKEELKAQHPELYAAVHEDGAKAGAVAGAAKATAEERDRVSAHLTMGESSGDLKTAIAAIKDGSGMTATIQATYLSAHMKRNDQSARQEDDKPVAAAADAAAGTKTSAAGKDAGDTVADIVCGKKAEVK